uniref:Bifunctional polynucleotide phosphatase/kinase n=1 Tax=Ascaris suum TaxID=6253 RepID=F1L4U3_ASCSU
MSKRKSADNTTMDAWLTKKKGKTDGDEKKAIGKWQSVGGDLLIFSGDGLEHSQKIAGFDLDGTVITTSSGKRFPINEFDWRFLYVEIVGKLAELHKDGYKIVLFTNQKGIQMGHLDANAFKHKIEAICAKLSVPVQVFVSLGTLKYRKPCTGMWDYMEANENGDLSIDRSKCLFIGDAAGRIAVASRKKDHSAVDRLFAMNIGVQFFSPEQFFLDQREEEPYEIPTFKPSEFIDQNRTLFDPPDTAMPGLKQEVIVLVGYPGCGKSTFAEKIAKEHGYGIVNRDSMKTWQKCVQNAKIYLQKGQSVIIDNTNGDTESRKRYCELAKSRNVDCRCFVFACGMEQAMHHCKYRVIVGTDTVHQEVGAMVLRMFKSKYQEPKLEEGFSSIAKVNFVPEFASEHHERIYRMFLCES